MKMKETINKLDIIKIKGNVKNEKTSQKLRENICKRHIYDKGLLSFVYSIQRTLKTQQ